MISKYKILFTLLLLFAINCAFCQSENELKKMSKNAENYFSIEDYNSAYPILRDLDTLSEIEMSTKFMLAICEIELNYDYPKAIEYFESIKLNFKKEEVPDELYRLLGSAHYNNYNFSSAIENYKIYKELIIGEDELEIGIEREITIATNANTFFTTPENYKLINLGENINSSKGDYAPVISADESTLIFTSRRPGGNSNEEAFDGGFFEDIYISQKDKNNQWEQAELIGGGINTPAHDASSSISADGQKLYIYRSKKNGKTGIILESYLNGSDWELPVPLNENINSKDWVSSVSVTSDEQRLYFTSNKKGGYGGKDIYVSEKDEDGTWGIAQNLGPEVNTSQDEESPFIHPDGKTLFFSSKGHNTMGGYDIYKSINEDDVWSVATNMGYPLNTTNDDLHFVLSANGKNGYYTSERIDSYGKSDIYQVEMPTNNIPLTMIRGSILCADSLKPLDVIIKVRDTETGKFIKHVYKPNPETGKYLIILPPGKSYDMVVSTDGYIPYKMNVFIPEQKEFYELYQTIYIKPVNPLNKKIGQGISVDNSFFNTEGVVTDLEEVKRNEILRQEQLQNLLNNIISASDSLSMKNLNEVVESNFDVKYKTMAVDTSFGSLVNMIGQVFENTDSIALKHVNNIIERGFYTYAEENVYFYGDPIGNIKDTLTVSTNEFALVQPINYSDTTAFGINEKNEMFNGMNGSRSINSQILFETILFDYNKSKVKRKYNDPLADLIKVFEGFPFMSFVITGHTDNVGSDQYNEVLSKERVESLQRYLVKNGVSPSKIRIEWEGEKVPLNNNSTEAQRAKNRRVDIRLIERF
ncbi:MAG: OmpA family protein [Vicingaceae bacterium]